MRLNVVSESEKDPWYADGLQFTCTQCGNCCTGGPGYVWASDVEIRRLAEYLKLSVKEVIEQYCRRIDGRLSFTEKRNQGNYDCVFLKEEKIERPGAKGSDEKVIHTKRTCTIYPIRPLQCRTWPFWPELLSSKESWKRAGRGCPGMDVGKRYSLDQIAEIRDARDWPTSPPTSGKT
jgi:Fe-S-cluster containining protein